jgi:hypothetical protein
MERFLQLSIWTLGPLNARRQAKQSGGVTLQKAMEIFWRVAYNRQVVAYDYEFASSWDWI